MVFLAFSIFAQSVQGKQAKKKATIQLTHGKHKGNVVKGKKEGEKEIADLEDVQKFFPKISTKEEGEPHVPNMNDEGPDTFVDNIASGLGDFQAELLVAGQDASKVCARDVKQFCGSDAMKHKHPIHCLGLLPDNKRSQIHRLCRNHLQQSLSFVCANDLDLLDCDPVMGSKIDCLTEGIEKVSEDCADQVRLTAKVIAKVNNAEITVTTEEGGHKVTKVHSNEYENWQCPVDFLEHHSHAPCCFFSGDCAGANHVGNTKFQCAATRCQAVKGEWVLKDNEGFELGGHLCCPPKKDGVKIYVQPKDGDKDDSVYLLANTVYSLLSSPFTCIFLFLTAIVVYRERAFFKSLLSGDVSQVQLPFKAIELTTFLNSTIFSGLKKEKDFVKAPVPNGKGTSGGLFVKESVPMASYGGI